MRTSSKIRAPHLIAAVPEAPHRTLNLETAGDTPILREYRAVKADHRDAVVLARLGDFFEMFGDDAEVAAPILGVQLTGRGFGAAGRLPMCGVPHQAISLHIRKLLDAGQRVVIWDQVGEVVSGRLVRRAVTRVLSPGMVVEADLLEPSAVSRCVALFGSHGRVGIAAFDPNTQHLELFEVEGDLGSAALADELARLDASELLVEDATPIPPGLVALAPLTALAAAVFDTTRAEERLRRATGAASLDGLGVASVPVALRAAGAVLAYCERAHIVISQELLHIIIRTPDGAMRLDAHTRANLELLTRLGERGTSLLQLLDSTRTPMGTRLLRARLQEPLTEVGPIQHRLDSIQALLDDRDGRRHLRDSLTGMRDLERLVARCVQGMATPRDLGAVRDTCAALDVAGAAARAIEAGAEIGHAAERCRAPEGLRERLDALLCDELPAGASDGGAIRPGADADLDTLRAAGSTARTYLAALETSERERTGIRSLRVGYNRVFGYFIEVPNAHRDRVPEGYARKQTLAGAERFVTPDLKEHEAIVLHARERAIAREQELLAAVAADVAIHARPLADAAAAAATLDAAQSLATVAEEQRWVRPAIDASSTLHIVGGRHPLVERTLGPGRFVPNDVHLDDGARIVVLTGPNMAGKSTYLRQTASIVLLAQIGSYVPATEATIGVCDRIFTRIGAHDDLSGGLSTFMVEMAETAAILRQATERSLVILDEIGRGTSTYDGVSIAQAVVEYLHDAPQLNCRTLFATHFHELTVLADHLPRVRNARVEVVEEGADITFLHRIVPGGADRSYGVHVAKLAGIPGGVLVRARQLLAAQERERPLAGNGEHGSDQLTLSLSDPAPNPVMTELASLDLDGMTPIAALNKLAELHDRAST
ncbi:MAG: DNA mismatch repair protein MutS [Candidatus Dormiibacterota bacterium]